MWSAGSFGGEVFQDLPEISVDTGNNPGVEGRSGVTGPQASWDMSGEVMDGELNVSRGIKGKVADNGVPPAID